MNRGARSPSLRIELTHTCRKCRDWCIFYQAVLFFRYGWQWQEPNLPKQLLLVPIPSSSKPHSRRMSNGNFLDVSKLPTDHIPPLLTPHSSVHDETINAQSRLSRRQ